MISDNLSAYEKNQNYNFIVRYLHGIRYKYLIELFNAYKSDRPDGVIKIIDIGCAHAKTFGLLNERFNIEYLGIEINDSFANLATQRWGGFANFRIINGPVQNYFNEFKNVDFIIALETLEHIPENIVVRIVEQVSFANPRFFICSVPNEVGPIIIIKNIGSALMGYIRHTEYTWRETFYAGTWQLDKVDAHGIGHKGFDWRWLYQTIRVNNKSVKLLSTPLRWLPKTLSPSLFFICSSS